MVTVLFAAKAERWPIYEQPLRMAFAHAGLNSVNLVTVAEPQSVDYIVYAPNSDLQDFTPFTNLKAVFSLWAGVETIVGNATLRVPLTRMVDDGLSEGMVEWCVGHTLRAHLGMDEHIHGQDGVWRNETIPPLARDRKVCILGLGALGKAVAEALVALRFQVFGWARSPKTIAGVTCFHGADGLLPALQHAEIAILLLPDTPATTNILNAEALDTMPRGAQILNPGRGPLIEDDALLTALNCGQIKHATLDVFRVEPLPIEHPFWAHPQVTVTPHIASETRPSTAAQVIAENLVRAETGTTLLHVVDRDLGY